MEMGMDPHCGRWALAFLLVAACGEPDPEPPPSDTEDGTSTTTTGVDESGSSTTLVLPDVGGGIPPSQTADCADYIACAQVLMLEDAEAIEQMYGPDAACWDTSEQMVECDDTCEIELAAIIMQLESDGEEVPSECDPPEPVSWGEVSMILSDNCVTGCHEPGGSDASLDLSDQAYYAIYKASSDQSLLFLVEPGSHEESYLWHKVNGSQGSAGGMGSRMPQGSGPLPQEQIDAIATWIDGGATMF